MPLRPRVKFAIAAGAAAVIAGGSVWAWIATRPEKTPPGPGTLLCPGHVGREPAPAASVGRGDFVVVELQSPGGDFHESTWATIIAEAGNTLVGVLSGEQIPEGIRPLQTDKHGFRLGHRMIFERDCIWEVFRPERHGGQILCGPQVLELAEVIGDGSLFPVEGGLTAQSGDRAQIIVAEKGQATAAWFEKIWTRIVTISPSGQVLTAIVSDEPGRSDRHKLTAGSVVRYNRDCIIGV